MPPKRPASSDDIQVPEVKFLAFDLIFSDAVVGALNCFSWWRASFPVTGQSQKGFFVSFWFSCLISFIGVILFSCSPFSVVSFIVLYFILLVSFCPVCCSFVYCFSLYAPLRFPHGNVSIFYFCGRSYRPFTSALVSISFILGFRSSHFLIYLFLFRTHFLWVSTNRWGNLTTLLVSCLFMVCPPCFLVCLGCFCGPLCFVIVLSFLVWFCSLLWSRIFKPAYLPC